MAMGGGAHRFRPDGLAGFSKFQAESYSPSITACVLGSTFTGDGMTPLPSGSRIELWTDCEVAGRFQYPHVAVAFNSQGEVTGIAAAETMPEVHDSCYLGLFIDGGHSNLGEAEDWRDRDTFFKAAVNHLSTTLDIRGSEAEQLDKAYELAAVSLRSEPGNIRDAFCAAAAEFTDTDDELDEFHDRMWDGMWDRLDEVEVVDSWTGHMSSGSVKLAVLRLAAESFWIVRIDNDDDHVEVHAVSEFESDASARSAIPEIESGIDIPSPEADEWIQSQVLAKMKLRAGRSDQSDAEFMEDLSQGLIDLSLFESDNE